MPIEYIRNPLTRPPGRRPMWRTWASPQPMQPHPTPLAALPPAAVARNRAGASSQGRGGHSFMSATERQTAAIQRPTPSSSSASASDINSTTGAPLPGPSNGAATIQIPTPTTTPSTLNTASAAPEPSSSRKHIRFDRDEDPNDTPKRARLSTAETNTTVPTPTSPPRKRRKAKEHLTTPTTPSECSLSSATRPPPPPPTSTTFNAAASSSTLRAPSKQAVPPRSATAPQSMQNSSPLFPSDDEVSKLYANAPEYRRKFNSEPLFDLNPDATPPSSPVQRPFSLFSSPTQPCARGKFPEVKVELREWSVMNRRPDPQRGLRASEAIEVIDEEDVSMSCRAVGDSDDEREEQPPHPTSCFDELVPSSSQNPAPSTPHLLSDHHVTRSSFSLTQIQTPSPPHLTYKDKEKWVPDSTRRLREDTFNEHTIKKEPVDLLVPNFDDSRLAELEAWEQAERVSVRMEEEMATQAQGRFREEVEREVARQLEERLKADQAEAARKAEAEAEARLVAEATADTSGLAETCRRVVDKAVAARRAQAEAAHQEIRKARAEAKAAAKAVAEQKAAEAKLEAARQADAEAAEARVARKAQAKARTEAARKAQAEAEARRRVGNDAEASRKAATAPEVRSQVEASASEAIICAASAEASRRRGEAGGEEEQSRVEELGDEERGAREKTKTKSWRKLKSREVATRKSRQLNIDPDRARLQHDMRGYLGGYRPAPSRQDGIPLSALPHILKHVEFEDLLVFRAACRKTKDIVKSHIRHLVIRRIECDDNSMLTEVAGRDGCPLFRVPFNHCLRGCSHLVQPTAADKRSQNIVRYIKRVCGGDVTVEVVGQVSPPGQAPHFFTDLVGQLGDRVDRQIFRPCPDGLLPGSFLFGKELVLLDNHRSKVATINVDPRAGLRHVVYRIDNKEGSMRFMSLPDRFQTLVLDFTNWTRRSRMFAPAPTNDRPSRLQMVAEYAVRALNSRCQSIIVAGADEVEPEWLDIRCQTVKYGDPSPHVFKMFEHYVQQESARAAASIPKDYIRYLHRGHPELTRYHGLRS